MASALLRKSVTDLTRRKARTVFTVLTLAIAVASVGIFAVPSLMDQAMQHEVAANRLADLTLDDEAARADAGAARGARAAAERRRRRGAQPTSRPASGSASGARRRSSIGVPDYARQRVDVVAIASGAPPAPALLV